MRVARCCYLDELQIWPGALYSEELAKVIVAAKDMNSAPSRNFLVQLLVEAFMRAINGAGAVTKVRLIPIPSSGSSNRRRGFSHSYLLSKSLARRVHRQISVPLEVLPALRVNRRIVDQSALTKKQRSENIAGAHSVLPKFRERLANAPGQLTYLVDDLITTGSTATEGVRALKEAGATPLGVLCAGVSPRLFT